ncbi:MAG TPA: hypothetical protein VNR62_05015 [Cellulomonas sp.]|nr:hypothetical protein [Cellulomonas sp.]
MADGVVLGGTDDDGVGVGATADGVVGGVVTFVVGLGAVALGAGVMVCDDDGLGWETGGAVGVECDGVGVRVAEGVGHGEGCFGGLVVVVGVGVAGVGFVPQSGALTKVHGCPVSGYG